MIFHDAVTEDNEVHSWKLQNTQIDTPERQGCYSKHNNNSKIFTQSNN